MEALQREVCRCGRRTAGLALSYRQPPYPHVAYRLSVTHPNDSAIKVSDVSIHRAVTRRKLGGTAVSGSRSVSRRLEPCVTTVRNREVYGYANYPTSQTVNDMVVIDWLQPQQPTYMI